MKSNLATETLLLIGGAAAGAVAMFLLDPDQGNSRRSMLTSRASQAASDANESLQDRAEDARSWLSKISESARKWSKQAADHVASTAAQGSSQAQSVVGKTMSDLADSVQTLVGHAKDYADQAQDHADAARSDITDRANSVYGRAKLSAMQRAGLRESHPYRSTTGHTIGTVGVLAIGAGLMYFLDPAKGSDRRAWTKDKFFSLSRKANESVAQYGQQVGDKVQGTVAQAKDVLPEEVSEVLEHAAGAAAAVVSHHGDSSAKPK